MPKSFRRMARKVGMPPGSLIYTGEKGHLPAKITITRYNSENIVERQLDAFTECQMAGDPEEVTWINVNGISQVHNLEKVGECFKIHPLVLEDILEVGQRPKVEDYDDYLYIVLNSIRSAAEGEKFVSEEISLVLGPHYVLSFYEGDGDLFAPVRDRLLKAKGRIRKMGADYLAYCLIDLIVDHYFVELEKFGDQMESLEDEVMTHPSPQTLGDVHRIKNDMIMLRKSLWPLREVIARLERRESPLISENLDNYFRDVYDHTIIAIDTVETYRDILSGMLDIYLSSMSNRLNEIMKVLTIIATIFMPLTFITSLYGMNFKHMPELQWRYGYYVVIGVVVMIALSMLSFFRRKRWI
ncbi:MAG: magnesium/cobalt transporter CorA [Deltaproteobacteria bacterium]|nr:magnesium/cobalt transporter CorA [Deltaproteobacteria bacterium]